MMSLEGTEVEAGDIEREKKEGDGNGCNLMSF